MGLTHYHVIKYSKLIKIKKKREGSKNNSENVVKLINLIKNIRCRYTICIYNMNEIHLRICKRISFITKDVISLKSNTYKLH